MLKDKEKSDDIYQKELWQGKEIGPGQAGVGGFS